MTAQKQRGRSPWPIPTIPKPAGLRCIQMMIPDSDEHMAILAGAIQQLMIWSNWTRDGTTNARDAAAAWKDAFLANEKLFKGCGDPCPPFGPGITYLGDDMGLFRQNGCKLEYSIDGECWCEIFDVTACIQGTAGQQGPQGEIAEGECKTFEIVIPATGYILPIPVAGNYQITIQNAQGGWSDGSGLWFCPDGSSYLLGVCGPGVPPGVGDPLPTANHMRLLALVDGTYYDAFNRSFSISSGQPIADLEFLPNDPSPSDARGTVSATVVVCNTGGGTGSWTHTEDFTASDGGWSEQQTDYADYVSGQGWGNGTAIAGEICYIRKAMAFSGTLTHFDAIFTTNAAPIGYQAAVISIKRGATTIELYRNNSLAQSPGGTLSWNGTQAYSAGDELWISVNVNAATPHAIRITEMYATGCGIDPL